MKVEEYVALRKKALDQFAKHWNAEHAKNPEAYPAECDGEVEWFEQEQAYSQKDEDCDQY